MSENLFKENIEKSKKVLKEHFERRSLERNRDLWITINTEPEFHSFSTFEIDKEELDEVIGTDIDFIDKLIWSDNTKEEEEK